MVYVRTFAALPSAKLPNNPRTHNVCTIIVQQYSSSTAENTRNYTRDGGGYSGQKKHKDKRITTVSGRTTPERGRYSGFCLSTPLHTPRSSSTYTAVDVYSSTYHTAARTCVGAELFLCRAGMYSNTTCQVELGSRSCFLGMLYE